MSFLSCIEQFHSLVLVSGKKKQEKRTRCRKTKWRESMLPELTSFAEIVQITDCQKVPDPPLEMQNKNFLLHEGEHLLLSQHFETVFNISI